MPIIGNCSSDSCQLRRSLLRARNRPLLVPMARRTSVMVGSLARPFDNVHENAGRIRPLRAAESSPRRSVAVVVGLVRSGDVHADVLGLLLGQRGELGADGVEVQSG